MNYLMSWVKFLFMAPLVICLMAFHWVSFVVVMLLAVLMGSAWEGRVASFWEGFFTNMEAWIADICDWVLEPTFNKGHIRVGK